MCANKVVIESAEEFAKYGNSILSVNVMFIPASSVIEFDMDGAVPIPGTHAIHFVKRKVRDSGGFELSFFKNSQFQVPGAEHIIGTASYSSNHITSSFKPSPNCQDHENVPSTSTAGIFDKDIQSDDSDGEDDSHGTGTLEVRFS